MSNTTVYQPALDEPSIFTGNHRRPVSLAWVTWYIRNNPKTSLAVAEELGRVLEERLQSEPRREMNPEAEPVKYIDMRIGNEQKNVVRMEWIIWYRHLKAVGYGSAWHAAHEVYSDAIVSIKASMPAPDDWSSKKS